MSSMGSTGLNTNSLNSLSDCRKEELTTQYFKKKKNISLAFPVALRDASCTETLWMPHLWRYSRPGWMEPWAA